MQCRLRQSLFVFRDNAPRTDASIKCTGEQIETVRGDTTVGGRNTGQAGGGSVRGALRKRTISQRVQPGSAGDHAAVGVTRQPTYSVAVDVVDANVAIV